MKIGKYGSYQGNEYALGKEVNGKVNLVSKNQEDSKNGFVPKSNFPSILIKAVSKESLDYIVRITPYAIIDDDKFEIIGVGDNEVVIATRYEELAKKHKMERTGLHEYKKSISKENLKVVEERNNIK